MFVPGKTALYRMRFSAGPMSTGFRSFAKVNVEAMERKAMRTAQHRQHYRPMNGSGVSVARFAAFLAFAAAVAGGPAIARADAIYGVAVDNNIYFVDPAAQSITYVTASLSTGLKANGFATDRGRNQLLYFGSNGDLYYYDIPSGGSGTVATASVFGNVDEFPPEDAAYYNGAFWYIGKGGRVEDLDNKLYKAELTYTRGVPSFSGTPVAYQLTASGSTTGMAFGDIAINPLTNMLYGSTTPGSGGLFFSLDMTSLSGAGENPVTVIASGKSVGLQLAYNGDYSVLYGQQYQFDPSDPANPALTSGLWYTVDISNGDYNLAGFSTAPGMRDLAGFGTVVPEIDPNLLGSAVALITGSLALLEHRSRRESPRGA
jgi:hypothetical protein